MPLSGMGDWGNALGGALSQGGYGGFGGTSGTGGISGGPPAPPSQSAINRLRFQTMSKDDKFTHLRSLIQDTARSRGLKLTTRQASQDTHNFMRSLMDLGAEHSEAQSLLYDQIQGVKDKQIQAPQGVFQPPGHRGGTGESVYVPTPGQVPGELNKQNTTDAFGRVLDPTSGTQTDPAGQAANKVLTGNLSAERLREAAPTNWNLNTGNEFPVNLIKGFNWSKKQKPGESGAMGTDPQGAPIGAYQNPFLPPATKKKQKGSSGPSVVAADPLQEEASQYKKGGAIPWIAAEAYKHTPAGQVGIAAGAGTQVGELLGAGKQGPTIGRTVFEQSVLQPYASRQRDTLMQVADLYDRYSNWKGKGKPKNPLTALGLSRANLGIGVGEQITGNAIRRFALDKYGDGQRPGWFITDPTRKDSAPAVIAAGLKRIQTAQKQGVSYGAGTQGAFTGDYLDQVSQGGFPSGNELTQDPASQAQNDPLVLNP